MKRRDCSVSGLSAQPRCGGHFTVRRYSTSIFHSLLLLNYTHRLRPWLTFHSLLHYSVLFGGNGVLTEGTEHNAAQTQQCVTRLCRYNEMMMLSKVGNHNEAVTHEQPVRHNRVGIFNDALLHNNTSTCNMYTAMYNNTALYDEAAMHEELHDATAACNKTET